MPSAAWEDSTASISIHRDEVHDAAFQSYHMTTSNGYNLRITGLHATSDCLWRTAFAEGPHGVVDAEPRGATYFRGSRFDRPFPTVLRHDLDEGIGAPRQQLGVLLFGA